MKRKFHERTTKHKGETPQDKAMRRTTNATVCMAIFTVVLAFVGLLTYCVLKSQLREMHDSGRDAQAVQRAFIAFSPKADIGTRVEGGKVVSWSPQIPITNSGSTAARKLLERGNVYVSAGEMPEHFDFPDTGTAVPGVLGPKDTVSYETEPIPISAVEAVQDHLGHVYVYGWARYSDAFFPQTKAHVTKFCYELRLNSIRGDVTSPNYNLTGRFVSCPHHNCQDEDCEGEPPN